MILMNEIATSSARNDKVHFRKKRNDHGITFLEVIIAGFIISLTVVSLVPLFSQPLESSPFTSGIIASVLAHNELEGLKKDGSFPLNGGTATIVPPSPWNDNYTIVKNVSVPSPSAEPFQIQQIFISVYEGGGISLPLPSPAPTLLIQLESNYVGDSNVGENYGL